jgi:hypothetical protein
MFGLDAPDRSWSVVLLAAGLCLSACGGQNRVAGTVAGQEWDGAVKQATYCEHCSGGERVEVVFQREGELATLILELEGCANGAIARVGENGTARIQWFEHPNGKRIEAIRGEVRVEECSRQELRASFSAVLAEGGQVSGKLSTALEPDAGYD